ncbi:MAG TPA: efflux RND transporter periplasmic adaptor subunit [Thermoanaerobaculia bacterium]|nr:efflux RND transporter periplasmic adaptor subunit [Thermoanaerobaculia bacterium]
MVLLILVVFIVRRCRAGSAAADEAGAPVVSVQVAKAERGTIADAISAVGTLVPVRQATMMPKIAAPIAQIGLIKNKYVRQGDVIAVLESRDLQAQRAEAASALQEATLGIESTTRSAIPMTNAQDEKALHDAHANVENARRTVERRTTLYAQGGISKKDLEAAQLALTQSEDDLRLAEQSTAVHHHASNPLDTATAEAKRKQAADHLANVEAQLSYAVIRAPFTGVITDQFQYQGEYANPGQKLVTIADTSNMIVKIPIADQTAAEVKTGDPATVYPDDLPGQQIVGRVTLVGRGADAQSRTVEAWIMIGNPTGALRPNGTARVVLSVRQQLNAVIVPAPAVTLDATNGNGGTVMVVDGKSVAHEVKVTVGVRTSDRDQITSGLNGGETVVTEGNYGLPDGAKVTVPGAGQQKESAAPAADKP